MIQKIFLCLSLTLFTIESSASINAQTFNPSTSDHYVYTEDSLLWDWPPHSNFYLGLNYNYAQDPLIAFNDRTLDHAFTVIKSMQTFDFMVGIKNSSRFALFLGLPIHFVTYDPGGATYGFPTGKSTGIGDAKILAKWRLTEDNRRVAFAIIPEIHIPTGRSTPFVSDGVYYYIASPPSKKQLTGFVQLMR